MATHMPDLRNQGDLCRKSDQNEAPMTVAIQRLPCSSHNTEENAEQTASLFQEPHIRSQAARRYCLGSRQHSAKFLPLLPDRHRRCGVLVWNIDRMVNQ